jgi:hypothetical protein
MTSAEIWKDVPEFEGLYQVSSLGRVKSVGRVTKRIVNGKVFTQLTKEKIRKTSYSSAALCEKQVLEIKRKLALGATHSTLAGEYGVSVGAISNISASRTWRHLAGRVSC